MTRFLLDSNAVSDFVDRTVPFAARAEEAARQGHRIGTCEPVVAELFYGLELSSSRDRNLPRLERALSRIRIWPFDRNASREYGKIAADLKRRGRPIQIVDMMIAALAMSMPNCVVVTKDSDFAVIPGLSVVDWTKPIASI